MKAVIIFIPKKKTNDLDDINEENLMDFIMSTRFSRDDIHDTEYPIS